MAGALVGGAALSAFLQVVFEKLASRSVLDFISGREHGRGSTVQKLKTLVVSAEAVLYDAAAKQITNPSVKEWLAELEDTAKDGRDLLEEIPAEASPGKSGSSRLSRNKSLQMIVDMLEDMMGQKAVLNLKELGGKLSYKLPTTSLVRESHIYGRDDDVEAMVNLLLANDVTTHHIRTIAIVGAGGIGKTTLAQHVFNDRRVKDSFDLNVWTCLSSEPDTWMTTKSIFDAVTQSNSDIKDLNLLQLRLKEEVSGKRLLLVFDDVRRDSSVEWETLRSSLRFCERESAILVTSRNEKVAGTRCSLPPYHLSPLSNEDAWDIFADHALETRYCSADPQLEAIGREIVQRCSGLPETTKSLGIFLRPEPDPEEWTKVLEHDILYSTGDISKTLMELKDEKSRGIRTTEARRIQPSPARCHQSENRGIKMNLACFMFWVTLLTILSGVVFSAVNNAQMVKRKRALGLMCDQRAHTLQGRFVSSVKHMHSLGILLSRFRYSGTALDKEREIPPGSISICLDLEIAYVEMVVDAKGRTFERETGCKMASPAAQDMCAPMVFGENITDFLCRDLMSVEEDWKYFLEANHTTGPTGLSVPIKLFQSHQFGVVFYHPVYISELPSNATLGQQEATVTYVGVIWHFESFAERTLSQIDGNQTILVTVYDVTNPSVSLPIYGGGPSDGSDEHLLHKSKLELGDPSRKHVMECRYRQNAPVQSAAITTASFFTIGLLGCTLHGAVFHMLKTREASDRIRKLEKQAEANDAANSQFLTTASREIKMPAYSILDSLTLLLSSEPSPTQRGYAQTALACGKTLISMIQELLDKQRPNLRNHSGPAI